MDWSNETYVRLYVRDTVTWINWPWETRCVLSLLLRKLDRAGVLDFSGVDPVAAVAAVTLLPTKFVAVGFPPLLTSETVELDGDRLLMPNYIPAQEASSSNAQRAKLHRATRKAREKVQESNDSLRSRMQGNTATPNEAGNEHTPHHKMQRDQNDLLRGHNDSLGNRNPTLRNATQHHTHTASDDAESESERLSSSPSEPPSSSGVDAKRVGRKRDESRKRRRGGKKSPRRAQSSKNVPAAASIFSLPDAERLQLIKDLEGSPRKEEKVARKKALLSALEEEVLRIYLAIRKKATGSDYIKDRPRARKAARELGVACVGYSVTPEQVIEYWRENDFTKSPFPALSFIAGGTNVDRAACALKPAKGSNAKGKGPTKATSDADWEDFADDSEKLIERGRK